MKGLVAILAALVLSSGVADAQIQINTSHAGPVRTLTYDAEQRHIISGGEDGKVKIWDIQSGTLLRSTQMSHLPVYAIAIHPRQRQIAVVHSDGRRRFTLTVWDWGRNQELYRHTLAEVPIYLEYSPQGTFLVYTQADFSSLRFLAAQSGRTLPYLRRGFGIVTFATIASSEERIMTYVASTGAITYWEIASGRQIQTAATQPGIDNLAVLENRRFAAGRLNDELIVVDILDGTVRDRYPVQNLHQVMVNRANGEIVAVSRNGEQVEIAYFTFDRGRLNRSYRTAPAFPPSVTELALHGDTLHVANVEGSLFRYTVGQRLGRVVAENRLQPVTGLASTADAIHLSTSRQIMSLSSDLFGPNEIPLDRVGYLNVNHRNNPLRGSVGLATITHGVPATESVVLWDSSGRDPVISSYDPATTIVRELPLDEHRSLRSFHVTDGHLLLLHTNNSLRKVRLDDFRTVFSYSAEGMETAVTVGEALVIGKSRLNPFDSSLVRIDTRTGETVRIDSDTFLVFDAAYDTSARLLYTLGLQQTDRGVRTIVSVHRGDNFQNRRVIQSYDGEDLDATLALDPRTGHLFTTLGRDGVLIWDGRRTTTLPSMEHVPRELHLTDRHIFAVNRDGSLSVWSLRRREPLFNVYLFTDGEWAAVTADGHYFVPGDAAERHLSFVPVSERTARRRTLRDFRLYLPTRRNLGA